MTNYTTEDITKLPETGAQWINRMEIEGDSGSKYTIAQNRHSRLWACSCPGYTIGWKRGNPNADPAKRSCKHLDALGLQPGSTKTIAAVIQTIGELRWGMQKLRDAATLKGGGTAPKSPAEERKALKAQRKATRQQNATPASNPVTTSHVQTRHARILPTCPVCGALPGQPCDQNFLQTPASATKQTPVTPVTPTPTPKPSAGVSATPATPIKQGSSTLVRTLALNRTVDRVVQVFKDENQQHGFTESEIALILMRATAQLQKEF